MTGTAFALAIRASDTSTGIHSCIFICVSKRVLIYMWLDSRDTDTSLR